MVGGRGGGKQRRRVLGWEEGVEVSRGGGCWGGRKGWRERMSEWMSGEAL